MRPVWPLHSCRVLSSHKNAQHVGKLTSLSTLSGPSRSTRHFSASTISSPYFSPLRQQHLHITATYRHSLTNKTQPHARHFSSVAEKKSTRKGRLNPLYSDSHRISFEDIKKQTTVKRSSNFRDGSSRSQPVIVTATTPSINRPRPIDTQTTISSQPSSDAASTTALNTAQQQGGDNAPHFSVLPPVNQLPAAPYTPFNPSQIEVAPSFVVTYDPISLRRFKHGGILIDSRNPIHDVERERLSKLAALGRSKVIARRRPTPLSSGTPSSEWSEQGTLGDLHFQAMRSRGGHTLPSTVTFKQDQTTAGHVPTKCYNSALVRPSFHCAPQTPPIAQTIDPFPPPVVPESHIGQVALGERSHILHLSEIRSENPLNDPIYKEKTIAGQFRANIEDQRRIIRDAIELSRELIPSYYPWVAENRVRMGQDFRLWAKINLRLRDRRHPELGGISRWYVALIAALCFISFIMTRKTQRYYDFIQWTNRWRETFIKRGVISAAMVPGTDVNLLPRQETDELLYGIQPESNTDDDYRQNIAMQTPAVLDDSLESSTNRVHSAMATPYASTQHKFQQYSKLDSPIMPVIRGNREETEAAEKEKEAKQREPKDTLAAGSPQQQQSESVHHTQPLDSSLEYQRPTIDEDSEFEKKRNEMIDSFMETVASTEEDERIAQEQFELWQQQQEKEQQAMITTLDTNASSRLRKQHNQNQQSDQSTSPQEQQQQPIDLHQTEGDYDKDFFAVLETAADTDANNDSSVHDQLQIDNLSALSPPITTTIPSIPDTPRPSYIWSICTSPTTLALTSSAVVTTFLPISLPVQLYLVGASAATAGSIQYITQWWYSTPPSDPTNNLQNEQNDADEIAHLKDHFPDAFPSSSTSSSSSSLSLESTATPSSTNQPVQPAEIDFPRGTTYFETASLTTIDQRRQAAQNLSPDDPLIEFRRLVEERKARERMEQVQHSRRLELLSRLSVDIPDDDDDDDDYDDDDDDVPTQQPIERHEQSSQYQSSSRDFNQGEAPRQNTTPPSSPHPRSVPAQYSSLPAPLAPTTRLLNSPVLPHQNPASATSTSSASSSLRYSAQQKKNPYSTTIDSAGYYTLPQQGLNDEFINTDSYQ